MEELKKLLNETKALQNDYNIDDDELIELITEVFPRLNLINLKEKDVKNLTLGINI